MHILIPNLHEDATAICQQVSRHHESVAQIREVGMNPVAPDQNIGMERILIQVRLQDIILRPMVKVVGIYLMLSIG